MDEDLVEAMGRDLDRLTASQRAALGLADAFLEARTPPRADIRAWRQELGDEALLEVVTDLISCLTFSKMRVALGLSEAPDG